MERITLEATTRTDFGKGAARSLRRSGSVPAVIYRKGASTSITINTKQMVKFIHNTAGVQAMVDFKLPDGEKRLALLQEYQAEPLTSELVHVDFIEVALDEAITITVPITLTGSPIGVRIDKGILQHAKREIKVTAIPDHLPGHIEIDINDLEVGQMLHVSDITPPANVIIASEPKAFIATVTPPMVEEVETEEEEGEEGAEPEVAKKGKAEGDEAAEDKE